MGIDLVTIAIVFATIFVVELPDKTFIATLVMSTRFRPLLVWVGVVAAFFVQTLVAVAIGGVLNQLPKKPIEIFAAVLFLVGGIILLRGTSKADEEEAEAEEEFGAKSAAKQLAGWKVVTFCFTILFLAEWGDLSQILTASMVLRFDDPRDGHVLLDGQDVRDLDWDSLRGSMGYVAQDVYIFSGSIADNIAYGRPDASRDEIREAAVAAAAVDFVEALPDGFDSMLGERGSTSRAASGSAWSSPSPCWPSPA